jgi:hypothetical protein
MRRIDTTPDLTRGAYIIDHSTETLLADRTTAAMARSQPRPAPLAFPDRGTVARCEAVCKTRAPKINSDAVAGVVGRSRTMPPATTLSITLHGANICPLGSGEELVTDCGCSTISLKPW